MEGWADTGTDCWLSRISKIKKALNISTPPSHVKKENVGKIFKKSLENKFQLFWRDQVQKVKIGNDGLDHNALRFYKTLKCSFTREPYLDLINNRNQRCWLSRLRLGAHHLEIQVGRYQTIPISERFCVSCSENVIGDEIHNLMFCGTFQIKRACFLARLRCHIPNLDQYNAKEIVSLILCPPTAKIAKLSNKYIKIILNAKQLLSEGVPIDQLGFRPPDNNQVVTDTFEVESDLNDTLNSVDSDILDNI